MRSFQHLAKKSSDSEKVEKVSNLGHKSCPIENCIVSLYREYSPEVKGLLFSLFCGLKSINLESMTKI